MKSLLLVPLAFGFAACGETAEVPERPNILWITHEDLSPIYGCYGDEYATTPNIDQLAANGYRFTQAYSNAPICAPARSTLITGMYAASLGTQHLRSDVPVPASMKTLPEVLRQAGYYTTNNVKTDYNFNAEGRWDELSNEAHWRNRPEGMPFFSVVNFMITHEGPINALRSSDTNILEQHHSPDAVKLPPYMPDSSEMRKIWAHMYDLLSVFDKGVGDLLRQLEEDGLSENTIVFVFSDHGTGLPGHKRWLNAAGLKVPFVLYVPDKYKHLVENLSAPVVDQMVGFVDFAPAVLSLAGVEPPEMMQGQSFLGKKTREKEFVFGYRDRADDCYEMSRLICDGRFLYVRHFMPQLPYYQDAIIFNNGGSYEEINRLRDEGRLKEQTLKWFAEKPVEELYDLENDRWEQNNLADNPEYKTLVEQMREKLHETMTGNYDTGLIEEGDLMTLAAENNSSVYEAVRNIPRDDFDAFADAANVVGRSSGSEELIPLLKDDRSTIRFWGLVALDAYKGDVSAMDDLLTELMNDPAWSVAGKAAEIRIKRFDDQAAYRVLENKLKLESEPVVLQAAISARLLKEKACPLLPAIREEIMPRFEGNIWGRYRNWSYPMFIGMALDQVQLNCGVEVEVVK